MHWWQERPMRMVQTNLREIDVAIDPDRYVESLREFSANVVLFSVGGIVANYPTELPFQYRNPFLSNDFLGEVLERVHAAGIRLVARFDFSKVNESIATDHPEWHYKSKTNESVNYNGQFHICLNSEYQQSLSIAILEEVAARYPIDGVFINMHGYQVTDYSGVYHGVCQCTNCCERFGATPPTDEDPETGEYTAFKSRTIAELFGRRAAAVKAINSEIATCNSTPEGTDIFRLESGTLLVYKIPDFTYSASNHVKLVRSSWPEMAVSNAAVHFVDFPVRYSGVSPHLTAARLVQDMVHGGWLDYYVVGTLDTQDDRESFPAVRDLFAFHAEHDQLYTGNDPRADVCLVQPGTSGKPWPSAEFLGLYRILAEHHVQFDVLREDVLSAERLSRYQLVIVPSDRIAVPGGRAVLQTGADGADRIAGSYFEVRPEDKKVLSGFDDIDLVYLYGAFRAVEPGEGDEDFLRYVPPHMFGPPEKCYVTSKSDLPGLVRARTGDRVSVAIPWSIGTHYHEHSHRGHARLVMSALKDLLGYTPTLSTDAPAQVEVTAQSNERERRHVVHFVNLGGQLGSAYHAPPALSGLHVTLQTESLPSRARCLRLGRDLPLVSESDGVAFTVPELALFETVVLEG